MKTTGLLAVAGAMFAATLLTSVEAEARGWRRARWSAPQTRYVARPVQSGSSNFYRPTAGTVWRSRSGAVTYSGVSRAEQDQQRRRDAWYEHAYNGWRPEYLGF